MITVEDIQRQLGTAHAIYARNKRIGGDNSLKGTRFEDLYAVTRIAELASACLDGGADGTDTHVDAQIVGFVDDLEVIRAGTRTYSQIKDVQGLTWHGGRRPLENDFKYQANLCRKMGISAVLEMVVSKTEVWDDLRNTLPDDVDANIIHFPSHGSSFDDLPENTRGWIETLVVPWTDSTTVEAAWRHLSTAWTFRQAATRLDQLLRSASILSACTIRPLGPNFELNDEFLEILQGLEDFEYWVRGDLFSCRAGYFRAHARFPCGSERWEMFQERILNEDHLDGMQIASIVLEHN